MTTATPKSRLRWYQYSLRSLFVITVLVAVAGSWFAVKKQQKERERAAVKAIKAAGGVVLYDYEWDSVLRYIPNSKPPGPAWVRAWLGDDYFAHVTLVSCTYPLVTHRNLETVEVEFLKDLPQLRTMQILGFQASDTGLEHLRRLPQLKGLHLFATFGVDDELEHLRELPQLEELELDVSDITDAGLEHLSGLTQLRKLRLGGPYFTDEGIARLQEALPDCVIGVVGRPQAVGTTTPSKHR